MGERIERNEEGIERAAQSEPISHVWTEGDPDLFRESASEKGLLPSHLITRTNPTLNRRVSYQTFRPAKSENYLRISSDHHYAVKPPPSQHHPTSSPSVGSQNPRAARPHTKRRSHPNGSRTPPRLGSKRCVSEADSKAVVRNTEANSFPTPTTKRSGAPSRCRPTTGQHRAPQCPPPTA